MLGRFVRFLRSRPVDRMKPSTACFVISAFFAGAGVWAALIPGFEPVSALCMIVAVLVLSLALVAWAVAK